MCHDARDIVQRTQDQESRQLWSRMYSLLSATLHSTSAPHIVQAYRQASPHCVLEELVQHVVKMCGDVWDGGLQVSCAGHLRSHTVCLSGHLSLHTTIAIVMLYLRLY